MLAAFGTCQSQAMLVKGAIKHPLSYTAEEPLRVPSLQKPPLPTRGTAADIPTPPRSGSAVVRGRDIRA